MEHPPLAMGRKSGSESAVALLVAFLKRPQWSQAQLARELDVNVATVKKRLIELQLAGVPLESEDDPPHVQWSVPRGWAPDGVILGKDDVKAASRLLSRLGATKERDRLLARLLLGTSTPTSAVVPAVVDPQEEMFLPTVEDAAAQSRVLMLSYFSASRGMVEPRELSPCRVIIGPPARFVARCHRSDSLKWFRVDRVTRARLGDAGESAFRPSAAGEIERFVAASVDGFHGGADTVDVAFFVREPESRWVRGNLPAPLVGEPRPGGLRVTGRTSAVIAVARFCVGLGAAARMESSELTAVVRELAQGALGED